MLALAHWNNRGFAFPRFRSVKVARRIGGLFVVAFLFAISFSTAVSAAKIEGRVLSPNQQPIRGLKVTATNLAGGRVGAVAVTSATGNFALGDLPLGQYQINVWRTDGASLYQTVVRLDRE